MTIIQKQRQRSTPEYYVYFNKWTGEILSTGRALQANSSSPFIVTSNTIAANIVNGTANDQHYIINTSRDGSNDIVSKSEFLQLCEREKELYVVPEIKSENWDIRVNLYSGNKKIVVESNRDMIERLIAHNMRYKISIDTSVVFEFYIVKRNNPDYLIKKLSINAADLIVNGKVVIDGSKLIRYANMTDIHVLTQRYFENYYFNIVDDVYIDTTDQEVNFRNWQKATTNNNGHITFNQSGDQLLIASAVTTEQMELIGYTSRFMEFYIVGDTPDKLIACLKVDIHKLQAGQIERFDLDYDIDKVNILYHNPKLKVNKRKIT